MRTKKTIVMAVVCFAAVAACGPKSNGQFNEAQSGNRTGVKTVSFFSGWVLKSTLGVSVDLGDLVDGDVAVVSFFTSYCTRCRQKLIDHQGLYEKYRMLGLSILGVSVDEPETQSDVATYVRSRGLTYPVVIDTDSKLVNHLNPRRTLPFSVLVDHQGNLIWNHVGYAPGDDRLFEDQVVDALRKYREL